ncbi:MAG: ATP-binding protein [Candidatus Peribacteraceae bacterium]|nr:ATP-binding protein [Candidatus Peribacteraceae bacterium]
MDFNFTQNLHYCQEIVQDLSGLLYYSHIPSTIAALIIGIFVLIKSRFSLLGKILFSISLVFSIWGILNLLIWIFYYKNSLVMSAWAPIEVFAILLFILCFYFTYVFETKKDAPLWTKCIMFAPLLLPIFLTPTNYNLSGFDIQECIAIENPYYVDYVIGVRAIVSLCIVLFSVYQYFRADKTFRKQILLLSIGISIFLLSFVLAGYVSVQTDVFEYEAVGLFGMVVFVGFLGYLIVRFNTFNIKLIAAQAIVVSLVFLIGSQFFFIQNNTNRILTGITLILSIVFGYFLVKSVNREIIQREKIEKLAIDLEKANQELKDLDRQKDELISIVSHQLATPVTSVKWYIEMLLDGDSGEMTEEQKKQLMTMQGVTEDLVDLVGMILDVSRIQLGRMKVDRAPLDMGTFFTEVLAVIEPKATVKKQQFIKSLPKTLPTASLDKRLMRMTLENLLSNAVKYTPEGGKVELTVTVKDHTLRYSVKDSGCGIPKEEQDKIFSKLFRATNVRNTEGNGLGLFAAKGAAEAQGGKVWFESESGKGTTFFVEVPLEEATN